LARLGVGTVHWLVSSQHKEEALAHSNQHIAHGLPNIEVLTNPAGLPEVVLSEPPSLPSSKSLAAILQSLGIKNPGDAGVLKKMWMTSGGNSANAPPIRKKQPASFLIVTPAIKGQIDFNITVLDSIWLEGQQFIPDE